MKHRLISIRAWLRWCLMLVSIMVCSGGGVSLRSALAAGTPDAEPRRESHRASERDIARTKEDTQRKRLWVLALGEVRVYDIARNGKRLIRQITLPNWSIVGFRHVCPPEMVLDAAGSAFISSNAQARLFRIDGDSFDLKSSEIKFDGRVDLDTGFGALAFTSNSALFGRTTPGGLLWKIDLATTRAVMVNPGKTMSVDECAFTPLLLKHLEKDDKP